MSNEKHTDGKWHVVAGNSCFEIRVKNVFRSHIANVLMAGCSPSAPREEFVSVAAANAKLMAAAPDLLDALKTILDHKDLGSQFCIDTAMDAIRKATE